MVQGIMFLILNSLVIYTFVDGIVGWDGEGSNILDFRELQADGILVISLFLFSVYPDAVIIEADTSLVSCSNVVSGILCPRTPHPSHHHEEDEGTEEVAG